MRATQLLLRLERLVADLDPPSGARGADYEDETSGMSEPSSDEDDGTPYADRDGYSKFLREIDGLSLDSFSVLINDVNELNRGMIVKFKNALYQVRGVDLARGSFSCRDLGKSVVLMVLDFPAALVYASDPPVIMGLFNFCVADYRLVRKDSTRNSSSKVQIHPR
jgi:hypothetical protein